MNDQIKAMVEAFAEEARYPKKTIAKAMKETGKKAFGVFPIYTPEEINLCRRTSSCRHVGRTDDHGKRRQVHSELLLLHHESKYGARYEG